MYEESVGSTWGCWMQYNGNGDSFEFGSKRNGTDTSPQMVITSGGSVGIGTTSPGYTLDVSGTIRATGDIIAYSDRRVKTDLKLIKNALDKVSNINGYTYVRTDVENPERQAGVIAQEVLEVLPEVVYQDKKGRYNVAYGNLTALLIEAIKELKERIKILEQR